MRRVLRRLGYRYLRGEKRNYLAETASNVAFRVQYIKTKLKNRDSEGRPVLPEVYLDESYINQNHTASRSWVDKTRKRFAKEGKGPRICIVGAGRMQRG
jgi:hypothetical protein